MKNKQCLILIVSFLSLYSITISQAQELERYKEAELLNDSAAKLGALADDNKLILAIDLLDKAIEIKPDYYTAYWNKLMFLYRLSRYEDRFQTLLTMERYWSNNPDIKVMLGVHYESVLGDKSRANEKYREAKCLYKGLYDSIQTNAFALESNLSSYCTLLKLLGEDKEAYRVWKSFDARRCKDPALCAELKKQVKIFVLSRSRKDLLDLYVRGASNF